ELWIFDPVGDPWSHHRVAAARRKPHGVGGVATERVRGDLYPLEAPVADGLLELAVRDPEVSRLLEHVPEEDEAQHQQPKVDEGGAEAERGPAGLLVLAPARVDARRVVGGYAHASSKMGMARRTATPSAPQVAGGLEQSGASIVRE